MTHVLSFINLKGGVGKTTCAVAVAEFLAEEHRKRVLVIDLDPQTNATISLISEERWAELDANGQTICQLFQDRLQNNSSSAKFDIDRAIVPRVSNLHGGIDSLSLLASSLGLIELQDQLSKISDVNFYAVSPVDILANAVRPRLADFEYVIIDCPPNLGIITLNGITISTGFVIPTIPDILSTYGVPQILNRIERFAQTKGISVPPLGIIISKYQQQIGLHRSKLSQLRADAKNGNLPPVFNTVIPQTTKLAESADVDASVNTLRQKYGYSGQYDALASLTQEIMTACSAKTN
jgi:chromosome partitioning protein